MINKFAAINAAKQLLLNNPYDIYHTIEHHVGVYNNALEICIEEGLNLDTSKLELSCWWHDIFKGRENEEQLLSEHLSNYLDQSIVSDIILIVGQHSFGQEQHLVESKLLYDADKIELVSISRWKYAFDTYNEGKISIEERDRYINEWNRRMPLLFNKLNFSYSNHVFSKKHDNFISWLKSIKRFENGLFI